MNGRTSSPATYPGHRPNRTPVHYPVFGDPVAIIDQGQVTWTSPAWLAAQPELIIGSRLSSVTSALPALKQLLRDPVDVSPPTDGATDIAQHWHVDIDPLDDGRIAIRLSDRREHGLALQRQLDDREQLLFTSRALSVGEMATTLAHELNQPIAAAASLLRGLRTRLVRRTSLDKDEAIALDRTIEQVMFASQVIARIRDFTQSHKPRPARIDLAALVCTSASLLDWDLQRAGVTLSVEGTSAPVAVCGDSVMLQQVLINLMRNAIDALRTDPPDSPQLVVRLLGHAQQAEVQVSDNGCGLDDEAAQKLFVPFASSKPTGMGLGLSICRSLIELHQGRLWFTRNRDRGATFHMAIPLAQSESALGAVQ